MYALILKPPIVKESNCQFSIVLRISLVVQAGRPAMKKQANLKLEQTEENVTQHRKNRVYLNIPTLFFHFISIYYSVAHISFLNPLGLLLCDGS